MCLGPCFGGGSQQTRGWLPPEVARSGPLPPLPAKCRYVCVHVCAMCGVLLCFRDDGREIYCSTPLFAMDSICVIMRSLFFMCFFWGGGGLGPFWWG